MNQDKKQRLDDIRKIYSTLSESERKEIVNQCKIVTVEGHTISARNTALLYLQSSNNPPSVIGGYQQWRKAGRQVRKGEHGLSMFFPVGTRTNDDGIEMPANYFVTTVFDISQVYDPRTEKDNPAAAVNPEPEEPAARPDPADTKAPVLTPAIIPDNPEVKDRPRPEPEPIQNTNSANIPPEMAGFTIIS